MQIMRVLFFVVIFLNKDASAKELLPMSSILYSAFEMSSDFQYSSDTRSSLTLFESA
jgi:hypothetical protein